MPLQQLDDQREIGGEALLGGVEAALRGRLESERRVALRAATLASAKPAATANTLNAIMPNTQASMNEFSID